jgi:hypothetical protein
MPTERRPLDASLAAVAGKNEDEAVAWWKARMEQIAAIPSATARAGALVPEWRELAVLPEAQRVTLTRARILAVESLTSEQQEKVFEARSIGARQAPDAAAADATFIREKVAPTLPGPLQQRVRETMDRP